MQKDTAIDVSVLSDVYARTPPDSIIRKLCFDWFVALDLSYQTLEPELKECSKDFVLSYVAEKEKRGAGKEAYCSLFFPHSLTRYYVHETKSKASAKATSSRKILDATGRNRSVSSPAFMMVDKSQGIGDKSASSGNLDSSKQPIRVV